MQVEIRDGVLDVALALVSVVAPAPLAPGELDLALAELAAERPFKRVLEELLLRLPEERAENLMLVLREGRGAFALLLGAAGGSALLAGNALSGTSVALARTGFAVTAVDACRERLRFAAARDRALAVLGTAPATRSIAVAPGDRLPFADGAFDVVVREAPFHSAEAGERTTRDGSPMDSLDARTSASLRESLGDEPGAPALDECRRVARGELVITGDNRLGYKLSTGRRGEFRVLSPLAYLRRAFAPRGRRTLLGWRRALAARPGETTRAYALYPHSYDFTHLAALDEPGPRLYVGPKERGNAVKVAAYRLGLFSVLTPSFALVLSRGAREPGRRLENLLAELAHATGEREPFAQSLLSTRGNNALVMTSRPGADERDPEGRWIVRVPLNAAQARLVEREHVMLRRLRAEFPGVPVPEPLFSGRLDGMFVTCERRLPGHSAAQFSGRRASMARLFAQAADHLAELVVAPRATLDEERFGELVTARYELAARFAEPESTRRALAAMHARARETLQGRELPLVLAHSDLRSKHVQIEPDGRVLGYYDWGTAVDLDLPFHDLLHLVVHERKQTLNRTAGDAWQLARNGGDGLRPDERAPLDRYCERLALDRDVRVAIEDLYPLLVGAMAERNWDYSHPRWLHRGFGI